MLAMDAQTSTQPETVRDMISHGLEKADAVRNSILKAQETLLSTPASIVINAVLAISLVIVLCIVIILVATSLKHSGPPSRKTAEDLEIEQYQRKVSQIERRHQLRFQKDDAPEPSLKAPRSKYLWELFKENNK